MQTTKKSPKKHTTVCIWETHIERCDAVRAELERRTGMTITRTQAVNAMIDRCHRLILEGSF
jgi:hypothetical protein